MLVVLSRAARTRAPALRALATHTSPHGTITPPNQSFTEYVSAKVQQHDPTKPMLVDALSGQTLTFGQFAPRVARAAERLKTVERKPHLEQDCNELKAALGAHPSVRKLFNTEKEKRDLKNTRSRWSSRTHRA